jgi:hypothetical protein
MVDVYGTPYTEALHVVERYRLIRKPPKQRKIGWNRESASRGWLDSGPRLQGQRAPAPSYRRG